MITIVVLLISTLVLVCEEWIVGVLMVLGVRVLLVNLDMRYYSSSSSLHLLHLASQHLQHEEKDQRYL